MFKSRFKVTVKDMDSPMSPRLNIGVIANSFGECEKLVNEFKETHNLSYKIYRILRVEQVCRDEKPRVLTNEEVARFKDLSIHKVVMKNA